MSEQFLALYDVGTYDDVYYDTLLINIMVGIEVGKSYEYIYGKTIPELIIRQYTDVPTINIDRTYLKPSIVNDNITIQHINDGLIIKQASDLLRIKSA